MQQRPNVFTKTKRRFESLPNLGKSLDMVKIVMQLPEKVDQGLPLGKELAKMCFNGTPARNIINRVKEEHKKNHKLLENLMHHDLLSLIVNF